MLPPLDLAVDRRHSVTPYNHSVVIAATLNTSKPPPLTLSLRNAQVMYGDVHFSPARNAKGGRFIPAVSVPGSSYPQPRRLSGLPGCQILMSVSACVGSIGGMPGLCARGHASPRLHALQGPVYPFPELASPPQERLTEEGRCGFSACSPLLFPTSTETSCVCGYVCVHSNYSFTGHRGGPLFWGGGVKKDVCIFFGGKMRCCDACITLVRLGIMVSKQDILWHR